MTPDPLSQSPPESPSTSPTPPASDPQEFFRSSPSSPDITVAKDTRDLVTTVFDSMAAIAQQRPDLLAGRDIILADALYDTDLPLDPMNPDATLSDEPIDPTTGKGTAVSGKMAWGGFENGRIPSDQLVSIGSGQSLAPPAAAAWNRMKAAAAQEGVVLDLTDSYRSFDVQVATKEGKPRLAAKPGTSNHGWGKAVDAASPEARAWIQANGAKYGWVWPSWARPGGSKPEDWHFEYTGTSTSSTGKSALQTLRTEAR